MINNLFKIPLLWRVNINVMSQSCVSSSKARSFSSANCSAALLPMYCGFHLVSVVSVVSFLCSFWVHETRGVSDPHPLLVHFCLIDHLHLILFTMFTRACECNVNGYLSDLCDFCWNCFGFWGCVQFMILSFSIVSVRVDNCLPSSRPKLLTRTALLSVSQQILMRCLHVLPTCVLEQ